MDKAELVNARWSIRRAEEYMRPYGVIKGINYVPSYCYSYIEMWHHFDEAWIRRELGYAKAIGINSLRVFVAACQWESRREQVSKNLDRFLDISLENGFSVMLTLQPNTYMIPGQTRTPDEEPFLIRYQPSGHDKSWKYKGARIFDCDGRWREDFKGIAAFVSEIVARYGQDRRVAFWDLYNEPWEACRDLLELAFWLAREQNPIQPLTSCWRALDLSDITSFHCYEQPGKLPQTQINGARYLSFEEELLRAASTGRPILCTECVARTFGNELKAFLPYYSKAHIGFYIWGFCAGSAQYHIPWDWPIGSPEPKRWFQCLLYPDGTPFDTEEIELIRAFRFENEVAQTPSTSGPV